MNIAWEGFGRRSSGICIGGWISQRYEGWQTQSQILGYMTSWRILFGEIAVAAFLSRSSFVRCVPRLLSRLRTVSFVIPTNPALRVCDYMLTLCNEGYTSLTVFEVQKWR